MRLIDADVLWHNMETTDWYNNADRDEVAELLVLRAPTVGGWVSVKDRLPDKDGLYLCWTLINQTNYHYQIELWKDNKWYWVHDVHYWMPLPKPPKEVSGDV